MCYDEYVVGVEIPFHGVDEWQCLDYIIFPSLNYLIIFKKTFILGN